MVDFFYKWYSLTADIPICRTLKIDAVNRHLAEWTANLLLPILFKLFPSKPLAARENGDVLLVASVTSFPTRIKHLHLAIETILRQSVRPDVIAVWLSKEQFSSLDELPENLLELRDKGVSIHLCEGNLKSHKKYYYVQSEYPGSDLFTFDDDIFYPSTALAEILEVSHSFPDCCICRYSKQVHFDEHGCSRWSRTTGKDAMLPSDYTFAGSGGGTLFPHGSLPQLAYRDDVFSKICNTADDIWLNCMLRYNGRNVVATGAACPIVEIRNRHNMTLCSCNYGKDDIRQLSDVIRFCKDNGKEILSDELMDV